MSEFDDDDAGSADKLVAPGLSEKALLATGIRIGTPVRTKTMEAFTARPRPDGLHIIDYARTIERIDVAGKFIAATGAKNTVVYTSREHGAVAVQKFCELTGAMSRIGRFMPGTFTNPLYPGHLDAELVVVADPMSDMQAMVEAAKLGVPVIAVCDTDNVTDDIDLVIPGNNRGRKAIAAIFWLLARSTLVRSGSLAEDQAMKYGIEEFETKVEEEPKPDDPEERISERRE
ncbi:MAG: 30S ribosomal protein S2 [Nitrososphaerota archaeon]|nr:30S ribosomal protein S2 [Nitrososphaerota archaeon]MDG6974532.1 30S ribosomal protein S2 [Nitrososphaerota archaeon]MDG7009458.1 30S ribosomal protein S2 [Nitrososphaerota archaeon]MDG7019122.1 30S ribosomal protein S2 [Nitrososphaerota archaeon]MDG7027529.1 30S ribosomal protein S2 [Nitrososphaerota archaeon]